MEYRDRVHSSVLCYLYLLIFIDKKKKKQWLIIPKARYVENFHISSTVLNVSTKQSFSAWTDTKRADRSCRKSPTFLHFQAKKKKKNPTASSQIPPYPAIYSVWNLSCYCLSEFEKKKKKSYLEKLDDILAVAFYDAEPRAQRLL